MNDLFTLPLRRTLDGFACEPGCTEGFAIDSLEPGTTLMVHTANSEYRLVVFDGIDCRVLVAGGAFPREVSAVLQGSSAGGSLLKTRWLGVGLRMELLVDGTWFVTSRVRSISRVH
jgi:hypothetical protein